MVVPSRNVASVDVQIRDLTVEVRTASNIWSTLSNPFSHESKSASTDPACASKTIVDGISADMPAGSLTAILGESGSGKTTLLNTISRRLSSKSMQVFGTVTFNGNEDPNSVRSAYVMQDDILLPKLTVRETLSYAVDLRLPHQTTKAEREAVVDDTIRELGLKECKDTRIGHNANSQCSGGEKRRTSVGVQMLADPSVLFCDEPTTGLDAHSAFQIIQTLKDLAKSGRTVIISIHTPRSEIWNLFDRIILLSKGIAIYSGSADAVLPYFKECGYEIPPFVNPADFVMDLAAVDSRSEAAEKESSLRIRSLETFWKSNSLSEASSIKVKTPDDRRPSVSTDALMVDMVGFSRQVSVMTRRGIVTTLRDPMGMAGCLFQSIIMAVGYGWIFYRLGTDTAGVRSREGALYIATYQSYLTLMFEIYRLSIDIRLFDMERTDGVVSVPAFLLSRRLAKALLEDFPVPVVFSLIYYFMVGFRLDPGAFFMFTTVEVASHYIAVTLALFCVAISRSFATACLIGNLSYTFNLLCTGYLLQTAQLPIYLRWIKWITYNFYTYVALSLNEFVGFDDGPVGNFNGCGESQSMDSACKQLTGSYIVQSLGFPADFLSRSLAMSLIFPIIYLIAAGITLTIFKVNIDVVRVKHKPESTSYNYGNPILRASQKVSGALLRLEEYGLTIRTKYPFKHSSSKVILQPLSVSFLPGKLNVIMGPSGSGKTSLLRGISKKLKGNISTTYLSSGEITMNGIPLQEGSIPSSISFVAQDDDALMPALTVRETLRYAAGIRLPPTMSKAQKRQRAEDLIVQMGLIQCADHFIGDNLKKGISGGQKRRVSIAVQVLADPLVLLLDEPTSGLDVCTAATILDMLRSLADEGRTIIMTIHQSRSDAFKTFDNVLLLARGGVTVYSGEGKSVLPHFKSMGFNCGLHTNPADFVLDLITVDLQHLEREHLSRKRVEVISQAWDDEKNPTKVTVKPADERQQSSLTHPKRARNPFWDTFWLVLKRSAVNISRNPEIVVARTLQIIGMAALFALFYGPLQNNAESIQSRMGYIQTITSFCFLGMLQNVAVYPIERDIFYREFDDGCYGVATFFSTYTLLEIPMTLISALAFGVLAAYAVNLKRTAVMFLIITLDSFCIVSCGESIGMVFCTLFSSHVGVSMHASSAIMSFGSTMAGIVSLSLPSVLQGVNYLSPSKYMVANIVVYSMRGQVFTCSPEQEIDGRCPISTGEDVIKLYNMDVGLEWNLAALVVTTVVYRLVAFAFVKASRIEWKLEAVRLSGVGLKKWKRGHATLGSREIHELENV